MNDKIKFRFAINFLKQNKQFYLINKNRRVKWILIRQVA